MPPGCRRPPTGRRCPNAMVRRMSRSRFAKAFIEVLVVHVMDAVHRVHVGARRATPSCGRTFEHLVIVEHVAGDGRRRRRDLITGDLVAPAIDRVEERFCEFTRARRTASACRASSPTRSSDAVVVAPVRPHQVVVLVLQRGGIAADLDAVALEVVRCFDHSTVIFGSGAGPRLVSVCSMR